MGSFVSSYFLPWIHGAAKMTTPHTLTVDLPMPPSVWKLYAGYGKGRHRTKEYKAWINEASWELVLQRKKKAGHAVTIEHDVAVTVRAVRTNKQADLENLQKALFDLLQSTNTINNDNQIVAIDAKWVESGPPCELTVRSAS